MEINPWIEYHAANPLIVNATIRVKSAKAILIFKIFIKLLIDVYLNYTPWAVSSIPDPAVAAVSTVISPSVCNLVCTEVNETNENDA